MVCELEEAVVADELEGEEDRLMEEGLLMDVDDGGMVEEELDNLVHDVLYPPSLAELL